MSHLYPDTPFLSNFKKQNTKYPIRDTMKPKSHKPCGGYPHLVAITEERPDRSAAPSAGSTKVTCIGVIAFQKGMPIRLSTRRVLTFVLTVGLFCPLLRAQTTTPSTSSYAYITIDPPGSTATTCTGISGNNVVGNYTDINGLQHGFLFDASTGAYTTIDLPEEDFIDGAGDVADSAGTINVGTTITGVSGNNVVGNTELLNGPDDGSGDGFINYEGFIYNDGAYTAVNEVANDSFLGGTVPVGVSGSVVAGNYWSNGNPDFGTGYGPNLYTNGSSYGFIYESGNFTTIDPSNGASLDGSELNVEVTVNGIDGTNVIGSYNVYDPSNGDGGNGGAFIYNNGAYLPLDPFGSSYVVPAGISGNNVVGSYLDGNGFIQAFLYTSVPLPETGTSITLGPLGTLSGAAVGISGNNVIGNYQTVLGNNAYLFDGANYTLLNVPNSASTVCTAIDGLNVVGSYTDAMAPPPPLNNLTQWERTNSITDLSATPESDGVPNLLKFFYDILPNATMTATDRAALPTVGIDKTTNPGTSYLTLTYRQNASASGITVNLQTSTDLQNWTTVTPDINQQIGTDPITGDPIKEIGVMINGSANEFIRLHVTTP